MAIITPELLVAAWASLTAASDTTDSWPLMRMPAKFCELTKNRAKHHWATSRAWFDEDRLFVYPVVMGIGDRLFQEPPTMPRLELVGSEIFQSGVVRLSYRRADGLRDGRPN